MSVTLIDPLKQVRPRVSTIQCVIDGGGAVPSAGLYGNFSIPFNCTVTGWVLLADQGGSAVLDVLRSPFGSFPTAMSITGASIPTLASEQKAELLALAGIWTTALHAGDILIPNLISASLVNRLNLAINITVP